MANLYVGTSGYSYSAWRGQFYPAGVPQKEWLAFYARTYNAVEINATFYRPFAKSVFTHWRDMTPPNFRFVLKGPKVITHEKRLEDVGEELKAFVSSAAALEGKQAATLWQFSAGVKVDDLGGRFAQFLQMLPNDMKQVFEFRHPSWFTKKTYDLLNQFGSGFVINDSPHLKSTEAVTDHIMYVRFHGPDKLYDSLYSDEQLRMWVDKIKPRLSENDCYLFFNNTFAGQGLQNGLQLRDLLLK